jgi:hypothetical protein
MSKELPIPPEAATRESAIELARIWVANGNQHVSLATGIWDDPAAWGLMLVDLARHIANSYAAMGGTSHEAVLARIRSGFDAEWSAATDVQEPPGRN